MSQFPGSVLNVKINQHCRLFSLKAEIHLNFANESLALNRYIDMKGAPDARYWTRTRRHIILCTLNR